MMGNVIIMIILVAISALLSGLSVGMLTLSPKELKRKMELGDKNAALIYPLRIKGNQLFVTLLISNIFINAMLSVFLGTLLSALMAIVLATALITVFGEVAPQTVFSRHALSFSAKFVWVVEKLMLILSPLTYPLNLLFDKSLSKELPPIFSKKELVTIIQEHSQSEDSDVQADELRIVEHALMFSDKIIEDVMTPRSVIKSVEQDEVLSPELMNELHESGFSRFPVYDESPDTIIGTLYLHDMLELKDKAKVKDAMTKKVFFVNEKQTLNQVLNAFFKTKHHLYIAINEFSEVVGLITIEDVIEEILGKQIVDEFDQYEDMRAVALRKVNKSK